VAGEPPAEDPRVQALRSVPLFEDLTPEELRLLADRSATRELPDHRQVFREGDPSDGLYVIQSGAVAIVRDKVGEPMQRLARLGAGGFFGEMGLLEGGPRAASAVTAEATRLLHVRRADLLAVFQERPLLAVKLRAAIIRRHGENVVSALQLSGRGELRTRVDTDVELELEDGTVVPARIENLSAGGACLRGLPADWRPGRAVRFTLRLPGGERLLSAAGRVAWRDSRATGIAFREGRGAEEPAGEEVRRALRRLLEQGG
jgi:CRP-like cAMP-binding protein